MIVGLFWGFLIFGFLYVFYKCRINNSAQSLDKFKYIWNADELSLIYESLLKKFPEKQAEIVAYHNRQVRRINAYKNNAEKNLKMTLLEAEHVMKSRRSLEILKEKACIFAKKLATSCGYNEDEIFADGFDCIGWDDLWALYQKHKNRILGTEDVPFSGNHEENIKKITAGELRERFQRIDSLDELHKERVRLLEKNSKNDQARRFIEESFQEALLKFRAQKDTEKENTAHWEKESVKDRNEKIFSNIFTITELKQKYRKLCKRNHPDKGGSVEAMKKLNQLYEEAFERIANLTNTSKSGYENYSENYENGY